MFVVFAQFVSVAQVKQIFLRPQQVRARQGERARVPARRRRGGGDGEMRFADFAVGLATQHRDLRVVVERGHARDVSHALQIVSEGFGQSPLLEEDVAGLVVGQVRLFEKLEV